MNEIAVQPYVIEEQVDVKGLSVDLDWHLAAYESEALAELQKEIAQMSQKPPFDLLFVSSLPDGEDIEVIRIFEDLLGEIGLGRRQARLGAFDFDSNPIIGHNSNTALRQHNQAVAAGASATN